MNASSLEKHSDGESTEQEQYGMGQLHHLGTMDAYATADSCDAKEESRLRLKMDLALIPLVSLLYREYERTNLSSRS